jgi:chitinase
LAKGKFMKIFQTWQLALLLTGLVVGTACRSGLDTTNIDSQLATIKIGKFGSNWKMMSVVVKDEAGSTTSHDFPIAAFAQGSASAAVQVKYGTYGIDLQYFNDVEKKQLVMESCAAEKVRSYVVDEPSESFEIKVCDTAQKELGTTPPVKEADVVIKPVVPGTTPGTGVPGNAGSVVGAYFVEWGVYGRKYTADMVPFDKITHLLYGFIPICGRNEALTLSGLADSLAALQRACVGKKDFEVTIHDPWAALEMPKANFKELAKKKQQYPNVKILPSIGGWTLSDPFFELAGDPAKRAVFINSVQRFLQEHTFFDGVDIDWEYPGGGGANPSLGSAADTANYTTLMTELRNALDELGQRNGRRYLLTSAVGATSAKIAKVEYGKLFANPAKPTIDLIFAMTYDYYGPWKDNTTRGHMAGLYAPTQKLPEDFHGDATIKSMLAAGVPPQNLALGVAMYGRAWQGVQFKNGSALSLDLSDSANNGQAWAAEASMWEAGIMDYKFIASKYRNAAGYTYSFDPVAKAPYLYSLEQGRFISFEDPCSTLAKHEYAQKKKLAGLFAWEIDGDDAEYSLLKAMAGKTSISCP